ncbi:arylmalonate decarboxylase [Dankookia rubra]|uniref:Arylmalonate decarboxylase n=1 Tax=Dankookia rubra TaxID=1442381 RepID=A0A4V3A958_9PROT|nr:arylmalonate decarboxylase [Dankookia rubra]TDH58025.1 arylmalonate decarboxylase [Dankookia rubra]
MADTLGWRMKLGVLVPSTNTSVQPEYDAMRPPGITNHVRGFRIPNAPTRTDTEFSQQLENMRATMVDAMDEVLTLDPGHVILATAAESAGGVEGARVLRERLLAKSGGRVGVTLGADAILAALTRYDGMARIGVVTPYMPVGDEQARRFFEDSGIAVGRVKGLRCGSPVLIAHTPEATLRDAIVEVDSPDVDAVVVVGTNLPMARVAAMAEFWLGKPVIALNTATYWHALRQCGIHDKVQGFGRLLAEF